MLDQKGKYIQCDSIIMDHAEVGSIPEIQAKHVDAAIIHEAAIGRINDEQLLPERRSGIQMHPRLPGSKLWKLDTEINEVKPAGQDHVVTE